MGTRRARPPAAPRPGPRDVRAAWMSITPFHAVQLGFPLRRPLSARMPDTAVNDSVFSANEFLKKVARSGSCNDVWADCRAPSMRAPNGKSCVSMAQRNAGCSSTNHTQGAWVLQQVEARGLYVAAATCLRYCASCERCHFISLSTDWRVCWWHRECLGGPTLNASDNVNATIAGRARRPAALPVPVQLQAVTNQTDVANGVPTLVLASDARSFKITGHLKCPSPPPPSPPETKSAPTACESWCPTHTESWNTKCERFVACGGCPTCWWRKNDANHVAVEKVVEIRKWASAETLDFNYRAALKALQHAACCAGNAILPKVAVNSEDSTSNERITIDGLLRSRRRMCYSFAHLPMVASLKECNALRDDAYAFARVDSQRVCPSVHQYMQPATLALSQYLELDKVAACPESFDPLRTLVAHVSSRDAESPSLHDVPLAFHLAAWAASGLPLLHVVIDDEVESLILSMLLMLREHTPPPRQIQIHIRRIGTEFAALTCARHLALGHSALNGLLLSNARLINVYAPMPLHDTWATSCDTSVWVLDPLSRAEIDALPWWEAPAQERLHMSIALHNSTIQFERHRHPWVPCSKTEREDGGPVKSRRTRNATLPR